MKSWYVTGVSGGIGRAIARAALDAGAQVYGSVRRDTQRAAFEALAPGRAHALLLDVTDADAIEAARGRLEADGGIDILVNNAGVGIVGAAEETSIDEARAIFEVNLFGLLRVTQSVLPMMRARGSGHVVNLSSGVGLTGLAGMALYAASKGAVESLSEAMAAEVAPFGIHVSLVEAGAIDTGFATEHAVESVGRLPCYAGLTGTGRKGLERFYAAPTPPEHVAEAVLALTCMDAPPLRQLVGGVTVAAERKRDAMDAALARALSI